MNTAAGKEIDDATWSSIERLLPPGDRERAIMRNISDAALEGVKLAADDQRLYGGDLGLRQKNMNLIVKAAKKLRNAILREPLSKEWLGRSLKNEGGVLAEINAIDRFIADLAHIADFASREVDWIRAQRERVIFIPDAQMPKKFVAMLYYGWCSEWKKPAMTRGGKFYQFADVLHERAFERKLKQETFIGYMREFKEAKGV